MAQTFDVPVDVPWKLLTASPDMMDVTFCDGGFPPPWRSSLAIYAYEPAAGDLPQQLCDQKITYLKVTCSITGFQPTQEETQQLGQLTSGALAVSLPDAPADVPDDFVDPYFACYGVLLNVSVFPSTATISSTQQYTFDGKPPTLLNPYSDAGLTFTAIPDEDVLNVVPVPPGGPSALVLAGNQMQIALPACTNVVLQMSLPASVDGTVTAYQDTAQVFTAPLAQTSGVQAIPIAATGSVNKVVISINGTIPIENCFLAGLQYDIQVPITLDDYPHIIDFEPKARDLYQTATDQGEILTGSNSSVNTGKSLAATSSSEMGLGLDASVSGDGFSVGGQLTGKWGNTTTDSSSTQIDQSRERRETQGTTTNITQQYNILTGYHAGTNRAAFLMLPRPHTLQATDYRTFVRGLRMIEGVQEFLLIVSRPVGLPGLCIETSLETGHFPENVALSPPPSAPAPSQVFTYSISVGREGGNFPETSGRPFTGVLPISLDSPWTIDTTQTTQGQQFPGVKYVESPLPGKTQADFEQASASAALQWTQASSSQGTLTISGMTGGPVPQNMPPDVGPYQAAWMQVDVSIWATQPPQPTADAEPQVVSPFLVTSRDLCVCLSSCPDTNCVKVVAPPAQMGSPVVSPTPAVSSPAKSSIVYESKVKIPPHLTSSKQLASSRTPAARELMHSVQHHMLNSWRRPERRAPGAVGFLDSDYVHQRLTTLLPKAHLSRSIATIKALPAALVNALGPKATVADILKLELHRLRARANVSLEGAIRIRKMLLQIDDEKGEQQPKS